MRLLLEKLVPYARGVLRLVIVAVVRGLKRLPPVSAVPVPDHSFSQALLEVRATFPAKSGYSRRVDGVSAVVSGSILDMAHECGIGSCKPHDRFGHEDVLPLLATDVVDRSLLPRLEHELNG